GHVVAGADGPARPRLHRDDPALRRAGRPGRPHRLRRGDEQGPGPADAGHRPGRPAHHPRAGGMAARRDAQDPGRAWLLLPPARRRCLPLRQHLRAVRQLRRRPGVHPAAPGPASRRHCPPRRRRCTRLAYRGRPALTRHRSPPGTPPAAHANSQKLDIVADIPEGRLMERWFGYLTDQMIRRGVHKSVQALEADIRAWIENWNQDPKPFTWTKTAEELLDSLARYIARISGAEH